MWVGVAACGACGCGTWRGSAPAATPGGATTDSDRTIADLRAKNAGYVRRIEELENRVFVLEDQLESRTHGEPQRSRGGLAVRKLTADGSAANAKDGPAATVGGAERSPAPKVSRSADRGTSSSPSTSSSAASTSSSTLATADPAGPPGSLVDDQPVEYVGEARGPTSGSAPGSTRRKVARRPQLRLWGADARPPGQASSKLAGAGRASPSGGSGTGVTAAAVGEIEPLRLYRESLAALRSGQESQAIAGFRRFLASYPAHEQAASCQYWIAESDYDRRQFALAEQGFRLVMSRYPKGSKVPDAMLKLALSLGYLGDRTGARAMLTRLTREFPKHEAARLATTELARPADQPPPAGLAPRSPLGASASPTGLPSASQAPGGRAAAVKTQGAHVPRLARLVAP
jgi:tol-pal system protein YbgF